MVEHIKHLQAAAKKQAAIKTSHFDDRGNVEDEG